MKKEIRDELSELMRDRGAWAASATLSLPAIIYFLLSIQGKANVLLIGLYVIAFLFIASNSVYIWFFAKKKVPAVLQPGAPSSGKDAGEKLVDKYPHLIPYARVSLIISFVLTLVLVFVPPLNRPVMDVVWGTPTLTPTQTLTLTPSPTVTLTPSPRPESVSHFYMIVLDASEKMKESFDGRSKWEAALGSVKVILEGLNSYSNYGLVAIGGSSSGRTGSDLCGEPSALASPFASKLDVWNQIGQLQPAGGGSFYTAFTLAKNQLENLPSGTIKTLIYITGSSDTCEDRDEWKELETAIQLSKEIGLYSEIIILDENAGLKTLSFAERINRVSENETTKAQVPQNNAELQQNIVVVVQQVTTYVEKKQREKAVETASVIVPVIEPISPVASPTPTSQGTVIIPPTPNSPPTSTPTNLPTKTATPITPPTATTVPFVELLSVNYLQPGVGCQIDITVRVSGSDATGSFHAWNANYPPQGDVYPLTTLQVGTYSGYLVTLGGLTPEYYRHEVWFEYNGIESNRLMPVCPGLTPAP